MRTGTRSADGLSTRGGSHAIHAYAAVRTRNLSSLRTLVAESTGSEQYPGHGNLAAQEQANVRNNMYLTSEALRLIEKDNPGQFTAANGRRWATYRIGIEQATQYIPGWVKVAVALALGLGTMVGWKPHCGYGGREDRQGELTYAQGASAESGGRWGQYLPRTSSGCR